MTTGRPPAGSAMRLGLLHNHYHLRGGEESVLEFEAELLAARGHAVRRFDLFTDDWFHPPRARALTLLWRTAWNRPMAERVRRWIRAEKLEVGHVHNWFPLFSPSVWRAHREEGIPVLQTLHNFRMGCAAGTLTRAGSPCELCLEGDRSHAVRHRCYRGSGLQTRLWKRTIDGMFSAEEAFTDVSMFLAPSRCVAEKHLALGLPAERVKVLPHACPDPLAGREGRAVDPEAGAVFVGRLSPEKGLDVLLEAWRDLDVPLTLVGTGPMAETVARFAEEHARVRWLRELPRERVFETLESAAFLVAPHLWNEAFGLTTIEAMAGGRAVVASAVGGPAESVVDGTTGRLVAPGDADALRAAVLELHRDPDSLLRLGRAARARYETYFHPRVHAEALESLVGELTNGRRAAA